MNKGVRLPLIGCVGPNGMLMWCCRDNGRISARDTSPTSKHLSLRRADRLERGGKVAWTREAGCGRGGGRIPWIEVDGCGLGIAISAFVNSGVVSGVFIEALGMVRGWERSHGAPTGPLIRTSRVTGETFRYLLAGTPRSRGYIDSVWLHRPTIMCSSFMKSSPKTRVDKHTFSFTFPRRDSQLNFRGLKGKTQ